MGASFITLEGIDGAGKSSHVDAIAGWLRARHREVVVTREPGGTPLAETLRGALLQQAMNPLTEALLMFAARSDHVEQVIRPALARGASVLCDRFTDASFAYQGGGRGLNLDVLDQLEQWVQGDLQPTLTLWFDVPPEVAASRRAQARTADRFEQLDVAFFTRVGDGYSQRAQRFPERTVRIDADVPMVRVWEQIEDALVRAVP